MFQTHETFPPSEDTVMHDRGWRHELVYMDSTIPHDDIDLINAMYANGGKDKLSEDILDSDSPVTGLYMKDKTDNTGITPDQFIEAVRNVQHLQDRPWLTHPETGGVMSHWVMYYEGDVLRGAVRIIPENEEGRMYQGNRYKMAHYMDGMVIPDSTGSMSWIYTSWAWRTVKECMHACGFDGYNFHGPEGSRIVEYKLRQLQDIRFTELTLDNEIEYTEEEDGTKGITVWHYYR